MIISIKTDYRTKLVFMKISENINLKDNDRSKIIIEKDIHLKRKTSDFSIFELKNTGPAGERHV